MNDIQLLKMSRKILGLTQGEFAKVLNVAHITVRQWECGVRKPAESVFKSILALIIERIDATTNRQNFIDETVERLKQKRKEGADNK